jgi:predicted phosphodiesterase
MRILVISDIHSNDLALEAVIRDAGSFNQIWCLGDVVGYGPQPNECIERLRAHDLICMAGNHDLAVGGKARMDDFTQDAREMIFWTRRTLAGNNLDWLSKGLNEKTLEVGHGITLVHGSPRDSVWEYIVTREIARDNLGFLNTPICLYGHTHQPVIFRKPWEGMKVLEERLRVNIPIRLTLDLMFINPGSVGQPRDEDPRASYALIDLDDLTLTHHRVMYDVSAVQNIMKKEKLPTRLIRRLRFGQ